jgi:hypothetical protein
MASFRINFQAQTTGDHYIGYRTYNDPPNTYTVLTVNITGAVPQLAHVDIPVPGNLYCAYDDIVYTGYLIAACQPQTDGNGDGIPDLATQWTVTMAEQTDPCIRTIILCEAVGIASITISNLPLNTAAPDGIYNLVITTADPADTILDATVQVGVVDGDITGDPTVISPGLYKTGNLIVQLPLALNPVAPDPLFVVTMEDCPPIDLTDYICTGHTELSGDTIYDLALGVELTLCADTSTLGGLPTGYLATEVSNCHCQECKNIIVTTNGSSGYITISYATCWDGSNPLGADLTLITREIQFDETVDLGCVVPTTIYIDESNLSGGSTILSQTPCV